MVRIPLNPDHGIEGYSLSDGAAKRRAALRRAVQERGAVPVMRRLVVLRTYRKADPSSLQYRRLDADVKFIRKRIAAKKKPEL